MPPFEIDGGLVLALARAFATGSLLLAFGTLLFGAEVAPRALTRARADVADRAMLLLTRLSRASLAAAILGAAVWLAGQSANLADASGVAATLDALRPVLAGTFFGHLIAARLLVLLVTLALVARRPPPLRWWLATICCGLGVCLLAGHSHAWAMEPGPTVLLASDLVHVLSAGAWLGGLPPLLLLVCTMPAPVAAAACRWFSPLGKLCVVGIVLSAAWQFWSLIGGLPGLIGTAYGWMAAIKMVLLGVLFVFAVVNRYRLAPALRTAEPAVARRRLILSLALQTGAGLLVVSAAAVLSSLPPAMHEQPLWPFPWRPSLVALAEPTLRSELLPALIAAAAGLLAALAAIALRRLRWVLLAAAAITIGFALPHLDLLLVQAYPTSFFRSPTGFTADSIASGAVLYAAHCASCHGPNGRGDGPAAKGLVVPPADLTADHLWDHGDGELFWWLSHGIDNPEGGLSMPGFAGSLGVDDRWALIDAIRANNAGFRLGDGRTWRRPTRAPRFTASCSGGGTFEVGGTADRPARIVVGETPPPTGVADASLVTTIVLGDLPTERGNLCGNGDPAVRVAYGLVSARAPDAMAGTEFLVDQAGWLRAIWRPGDPPAWTSTNGLRRMVARIADRPIQAPAEGNPMHHH